MTKREALELARNDKFKSEVKTLEFWTHVINGCTNWDPEPEPKGMTFDEALKAMREGKMVKRRKLATMHRMWLDLQQNKFWYIDKNGTYMFDHDTEDILATDWEIVEG